MAAAITPSNSRKMWTYLVKCACEDKRAQYALNQIISSAVLDYITDRIEDDEYACVIGRRVAQMATAVGIDFTD